MSHLNQRSQIENRRQDRRALVSMGVRKTVAKRQSICQAGNISAHGILVAKVFETPYTGPTKCWLQFSLPGTAPIISARGRIVRQRQKDRLQLLAIQFSAILPSHRRLISEYVEANKDSSLKAELVRLIEF